MHVRVAISHAESADGYLGAINFTFERLIPFFQQQDGFVECQLLLGSDGKEGMLITYWDDEASATRAEAVLAGMRAEIREREAIAVAEVRLYRLVIAATRGGRVMVKPVVTERVVRQTSTRPRRLAR